MLNTYPARESAPVEESESTSINQTPHLNRARVKQTALELASQKHFSFINGKHPKFSRVGMSFLIRVEGRLRAIIADEVQRHPTKGKTLL